MSEDKKEPIDVTIPAVEDHDGNYYVSVSAVQKLAASVAEKFMDAHLETMRLLSSYLDDAMIDDPARHLLAKVGAAIGHGATLPVMLSVMMDPNGKRFEGMSYADILEVLGSAPTEEGEERSIH